MCILGSSSTAPTNERERAISTIFVIIPAGSPAAVINDKESRIYGIHEGRTVLFTDKTSRIRRALYLAQEEEKVALEIDEAQVVRYSLVGY